jgi:hypothetical protein
MGLDASCVHVRLMPSLGPDGVTLTLEGCCMGCPLPGTFTADSESESVSGSESDPET